MVVACEPRQRRRRHLTRRGELLIAAPGEEVGTGRTFKIPPSVFISSLGLTIFLSRRKDASPPPSPQANRNGQVLEVVEGAEAARRGTVASEQQRYAFEEGTLKRSCVCRFLFFGTALCKAGCTNWEEELEMVVASLEGTPPTHHTNHNRPYSATARPVRWTRSVSACF